jgi:hypothetical protein
VIMHHGEIDHHDDAEVHRINAEVDGHQHQDELSTMMALRRSR